MTMKIRKRDWLYIPTGYDFAALYKGYGGCHLVYSTVPFSNSDVEAYMECSAPPSGARMGSVTNRGVSSQWTYDHHYYEEYIDIFDGDFIWCASECERRPAGLPMDGVFIEDVDPKLHSLAFWAFHALGVIDVPEDDSYEPGGDYDYETAGNSANIRIEHRDFLLYNRNTNNFDPACHMTMSELMLLTSMASSLR